jgi:hypothetical protein
MLASSSPDHQLVRVRRKVGPRIRQLGEILRILQVKVVRRSPRAQVPGQRG